MITNIKTPIFFLLLGVLVSCAKPVEKTVTLENIELTAEGPLFEGSNTFQATLTNSLADFLKENNLTKEDIAEVTVAACELSTNDSNYFNIYNSVNVLLSSDNSDMQNVAVINPITENKNTQTAEVAKEQEGITAILKDENVYVIGDAIIKEDVYDNLSFTATIKLNVKHYKK